MIDIGLSLTNRIAGGAMYKAAASFIKSMFASINSRDGFLTDVILYGLSTQAGTPTPDVPVAIVSTTGGVTITSTSGANTTTQTLPLGTTQLRSLPNGVSDRIYKDGSTWKLEQKVGGQTLNGSEAWGAAGGNATHHRWLYAHPTAKSSGYILTDRFVARSSIAFSDTTEGISVTTYLNYIYIMLALTRTSGATTAQALKDWLAANPTNVIFELATPVTTTITDPTLITALENIRTYQGVTNITASTPVSGSYLVI